MTDRRYDGKPFLRLVELYVQRAVGELSNDNAALLARMAPKLEKTYSRKGEWHEIIASLMEFDPAFDSHVRKEWERARAAGLSAEDFSRLVADKVIAA